MAGDKLGGAASALNVWLHQKWQTLNIGVFQILKGGLWKNIGRRSYLSQYGGFPSLLFCTFISDKDATYLLPIDTP